MQYKSEGSSTRVPWRLKTTTIVARECADDGDTADNNNMRMILDFTAAESRMAFSSD